jgi:nucleotide-binding universal stress UspA family protein
MMRSDVAGSHDSPVVVAGVDGDGGPSAVLRAAAEHARLTGANLVVACVMGMPVMLADDYPFEWLLAPDGHAASVFAELDETLFAYGVPWQVTRAVGDPAGTLADLATRNRALAIFISADVPGARGWYRRFTAGSVAGRLARLQPAPVVMVPVDRTMAAGRR